MIRTKVVLLFVPCLLVLARPAAGGRSGPKVVGEVFGRPVTAEEFAYFYRTAAMFTRTGKASRSDEETRQKAWQNLIFRHEANRLKITVGRGELMKEVERLLSERDIKYGTKEYRDTIKAQFGESVDVFERRIEDLLIINKFMGMKTQPEITVTEEEMKQKFLNQYNSFESEYIKFESEEQAKEFLEKLKEKPRLWKDTYDEKRSEGQKGAAWINMMALEALIDLWKIPRDDAYRILSRDEGEFVLGKFFYGDAVFRLLHKKEADMEKYTDKRKEYYRKSMTAQRKRKIVKDYFEDLLERATYRDYVAEERRAATIEKLKKRALVTLETNAGVIGLKLFPDVAPKACENFTGLIEKGYYNGLIFHRVIKDFMIQGGDPTGTGTGGDSMWGGSFQDEVSDKILFDRPGLLAMANSGPNTNKSQFFITTKATPHLNKKHTIFGEVILGYEAVEKIERTPTDSSNRPKEEQKIIRAYIGEPKQKP